jgi:hypothetical protein
MQQHPNPWPFSEENFFDPNPDPMHENLDDLIDKYLRDDFPFSYLFVIVASEFMMVFATTAKDAT